MKIYKEGREAVLDKKVNNLMDDILNCNTQCESLGKLLVDHDKKGYAKTEQMIKMLPALPFVRDQLVNFIFSSGITTGSSEADARLDEWLRKENLCDTTNYGVLQEVIGNAAVYGEWGLRWYEGDVYDVRKGRYACLIDNSDGIQKVEGYVMSKKDKNIPDDFNLDEIYGYEDINAYFEDHGLIFLDTNDFVNVRNEPARLHGQNPFERDELRLDLLLSVYEKLNKDLNYNGPGRLILRPRTGFSIIDEENDTSTSMLLNTANRKEINEKAMEEAKRVAKQLGSSQPDSIIVLSNAFSEKIEKLPKVTKSTEFFDWIENEGVILAQVLGMSPTLLETGDIHGNVSVEKVIDSAMRNTIVPKRRNYGIQISDMLASHLDLPKFEFTEYDNQAIADEYDIRSKMTNSIRDLAYAEKALRADDIDYAPLTEALDTYTQILIESLHDDSGNIRKLN